jgi:hypothetical protein
LDRIYITRLLRRPLVQRDYLAIVVSLRQPSIHKPGVQPIHRTLNSPLNLVLSHLFAPRFVPSANPACNQQSIKQIQKENRKEPERLAQIRTTARKIVAGEVISICATARSGREKVTTSGGLWINWLRL